MEKLFRRRLLNGRRSFAEHSAAPRRVAWFHNARIYRAYFFAQERREREKERARAPLSSFFLRFIFIGKFIVNLSGTIYRGGTLRANESDLVKKKKSKTHSAFRYNYFKNVAINALRAN